MKGRSAIGERNRQTILDAAAPLFRREGIRAVGMDRIVAESGLAKMTLYRQFATKDDLVVAYLDRCSASFWAAVEADAARHEAPADRLVAFIDTVIADAAQSDSRGCPFTNTQAEFGGLEHRVHAVVRNHAGAVRSYLAKLAREAGLADPRSVAEQLFIIVDGIYAATRALGSCPAKSARQLTNAVISAARAA